MVSENPEYASMSHRQFGTLRYIKDNSPHIDVLRGFHQITLWSLLHRGYIKKTQLSNVQLTDVGRLALEYYEHATYSERKKEADLTDRVQRLLRAAKSRSGQKAA